MERSLDESPGWPYGRVRVRGTHRIGAEHGLSGQVHRVEAEAADGAQVSFIVKQDTADGVHRALAFQRSIGRRLQGSIPVCFAGGSDVARQLGILLLEDVAPASQGDVLVDPGGERARTAIRVLARHLLG